MDYKNYKQRLAIEAKNKKRWLAVNPNLTDHSGIYFLTREEDGFKYAYIGQAKHILSRLAQHLVGFQRVDLSLKAHGLYSEDNPTGWKVGSKDYPITELDEMEQFYILKYAQYGYQLRNKTSGSQGTGKAKIDEYKPAKGYRDGIKQGYKNASRDIAHLFDLHLDYKPKSDKPNKNQEKAMEKFKDFLEYYKGVKE
jgi:hypothetical protein